MTENEAKETLEIFDRERKEYMESMPSTPYFDRVKADDFTQSLNIAIKVLEEIQKYREIGTVERFKQLAEQFKPHVTDKTSCPERHCNKCDKYRKENEKYHEIGTVEECREARERQTAKKPILNENSNVMFCPVCERKIRRNYDLHCSGCGQAIDWIDTP